MAKRFFLFMVTNILVMLAITVVFGVLSFFFPGLGWGMGMGRDGSLNLVALAVSSLVWGSVGSFISLQLSRWMAKKSMGIQLLDGNTGNPELDWLHGTVKRYALEAGLAMPEVGIYDSSEINAFATGPSKSRSLVAVSSGLLDTMEHAEIEGVVAHEISHIANGDMVTMAIIQGVVNSFVIFFSRIIGWAVGQVVDRDREDGQSALSYGAQVVTNLVMEILLGILASMVTAWFSRKREFRADAGGAFLAGRDKMIAALQRLQQTERVLDPRGPGLATARISGKSWMAVFSTHPPLEVRIEALRQAQ
ncbi:MAG: protease HtpX [Fibrobacterota bacterium]|nr:protease HtpX [Fibrobacterota bacterium]QQS05470.1 MAG: protease HtpX [Fibrobacterota bacterium]